MFIIKNILLLYVLFISTIAHATIVNDPSVSLNFQDIKVRSALQLLAEVSGLNIIVSDKIQSSMTLHFNGVTWQQALDVILQTQGLGKRQYGNIMLVAPSDEIAAYEKQQLSAMQQADELAPLHSELMTIHYGKAADIASLLKSSNRSLLSKRGNVSVDVRTNTIWIQDATEKLIDIKSAIKKLDVPAKQVLIEARIVNIDSHFAEELGVRFGLTHFNAVQSHENEKIQHPLKHLNIDLPVVGVGGGSASMGIALAKLGRNILLDLELAAMESEGSGQVISRPRLITTDQQPAIIEAGEEIPYQQETSGGSTNIAFKKAVLSLKVTPQVVSDEKVMLSLKVNQDKPGAREVLGVPSIDTRELQTQVTVNNGETIVLGGIYEENHDKQIQRVPFLGSLPVIGALFRHTKTNSTRKELLIFVTPNILGLSQSRNEKAFSSIVN